MEKAWLAEDCFYVDKRERAARLLGALRGDRRDLPIIEDNGRPFAILDPRAAIRRGLHHDMNIEKLAWPVSVITDGDDKNGVLAKFANTGAPYLPATLGRPPRKAGYLSAQQFLASAYDEGPDAAASAQGLPPLWADSTIEDAVQAFAASALPYLPVIGENIEGVVRREAIVRYCEHDAERMGKKDFAGNRKDVRGEGISSLIEDHVPILPPDAELPEIQDALADYPCWFVEGDGFEAVTAVSVLQAIQASKVPTQGAPVHFRQTNPAPS